MEPLSRPQPASFLKPPPVYQCDDEPAREGTRPEEGGEQDKGRELAIAVLQVLTALDTASPADTDRSLGFPSSSSVG